MLKHIFKLCTLREMIAVAHTELLKTRCPRARTGAGARVVEARTHSWIVVGLSFARRWDIVGSVRVPADKKRPSALRNAARVITIELIIPAQWDPHY